MYYYYCVSLFGVRPWWKRHLTKLQVSTAGASLTPSLCLSLSPCLPPVGRVEHPLAAVLCGSCR
jgi:hypothetical protein